MYDIDIEIEVGEKRVRVTRNHRWGHSTHEDVCKALDELVQKVKDSLYPEQEEGL